MLENDFIDIFSQQLSETSQDHNGEDNFTARVPSWKGVIQHPYNFGSIFCQSNSRNHMPDTCFHFFLMTIDEVSSSNTSSDTSSRSTWTESVHGGGNSLSLLNSEQLS